MGEEQTIVRNCTTCAGSLPHLDEGWVRCELLEIDIENNMCCNWWTEIT